MKASWRIFLVLALPSLIYAMEKKRGLDDEESERKKLCNLESIIQGQPPFSTFNSTVIEKATNLTTRYELFTTPSEYCAPPFLVCIKGPSGSGKTHLAKELANKINRTLDIVDAESVLINSAQNETNVISTKNIIMQLNAYFQIIKQKPQQKFLVVIHNYHKLIFEDNAGLIPFALKSFGKLHNQPVIVESNVETTHNENFDEIIKIDNPSHAEREKLITHFCNEHHCVPSQKALDTLVANTTAASPAKIKEAVARIAHSKHDGSQAPIASRPSHPIEFNDMQKIILELAQENNKSDSTNEPKQDGSPDYLSLYN